MIAPRRSVTRRDAGFTLVEILVAIVLVGILAAVVVVGVGRLSDKATTASCAASADAARTATNVYLAATGAQPTSFEDLTTRRDGAAPPLDVPASVAVSGRSLRAATWELTMSDSAPPVFTCIDRTPVAATTTTTAPATTTTAQVSNGVSATTRISGDFRYYGESALSLSNTSPITALSITITVAATPAATYSGQYTTFWSGAVTSSLVVSAGTIRHAFDLNPGQTIVPGTWTIAAQTRFDGTLHPTSGDTWSITSTSAGVSRTITGTF